MAAAPDGVSAASTGPGVRGVATYLCGAQHLPVARAAETRADLLGAPVSDGSVVAWNERAAAGLDLFTAALSQQDGEAGGSLTRETPGRAASSPDNDGTRQHYRMARARQARREGVREEPVL